MDEDNYIEDLIAVVAKYYNLTEDEAREWVTGVHTGNTDDLKVIGIDFSNNEDKTAYFKR